MKQKKQFGFTLVELLLVMAIIAVLAGLSLVVVGEAQQDAQTNATLSRLSLVHSILQQKMEGYQFMRSPINPGDFVTSTQQRVKERALNRRIIAEFINTEMPQGDDDIGASAFPSTEFETYVNEDADIDAGVITQLQMVHRPAIAFFHDDLAGASNSELLYSILETTQFNGISAVEVLGPRAFGDTDGDGNLEVVDSWGNPIVYQFQIDTDGDGNAEATSLDLSLEIDIRNLRTRVISTGNGIENLST